MFIYQTQLEESEGVWEISSDDLDRISGGGSGGDTDPEGNGRGVIREALGGKGLGGKALGGTGGTDPEGTSF